MWAEAKAIEKAKIDRIAAKAGGRANTEVAERVRVWVDAEAKEKVEISRVAAQAREKSKAEAEDRVRATVRER